ncbi:MAG: Eco57I restriction-modification methylase domain-containing protein [Bacteroidales bacterium]|nr:Eco57I restriction-modification methylase domain-containing protein [Bacteroidales bacterium]
MINFKQLYNKAEFLRFLERDFLPTDFKEENEVLDFSDNYTRQATRLGVCPCLELEVIEVIHTSTHDARVGLSKEVFKLLLNRSIRNRALILFVPQDNPGNYRFSLVNIDVEVDENKVRRAYSNPRRYSFLLGEEAKTHTPTQYLINKGRVKDFEDLQKRFSVEVLTKEFYAELFAWYQWALSEEVGVTYPNDRSTERDDRKIEEHLIRLITRLMFVWFIKQEKLIPEVIFDLDKLKSLLKNFESTSLKQDSYYRAILQNLFFATLNNKIEDRAFALDGSFIENKAQYGIKTLFRYADEFSISKEQVIQLFNKVPFLNGGLFECLDKDTPDGNGKIVYSDGFSRRKDRQSRAFVPNILFFDEVKGIISILNKYNFTIEENSPLDVEVALDPELLGKVFENLLGTYNPETKETARKQSGSFYTPREIVQYMVDESLIAYLKRSVGEEFEVEYRKLISQTDEKTSLTDIQKNQVYKSLIACKIIDPACGSGAFPMGVLNRMLAIIEKLPIPANISKYDLKLYLIENCIFGIDIQSIAVQISKLRFFISLICEQTPTTDSSSNFGIKPLPNLETKFVAANTLIGLTPRNVQNNLFEDPQIEVTKSELLQIRHKHFLANTSKQKKECREEDKNLREKLAVLLDKNGDFAPGDAHQLANWNPYDQNSSSPFFDSEWMFGIKNRFDIVIGNPPYVQLQSTGGMLAEQFKNQNYETFARTGDIYCLFYEKGWQLLKDSGNLCFITSNKWMRAGYGESTRKFFANKTNPIQLIDFAGQKIFESATVDTNILLFQKAVNKATTQACIVKEKWSDSLSDYVKANNTVCMFTNSDSWVVLNPIEQRIKEKIKCIGTPLKDWDINIYRGVLTGYNEAFIIDGKKKEELIAKDPKSAEIIRPILRGRDIKRYGYEFADLYLIATFPSKNYDIEQYSAVKEHLLSFGYDRLKQTGEQGARKKTNNKWFETQDSICYWDDFSKQKIVWAETMRIHKSDVRNFPRFGFENDGQFVTDKTCFIATGKQLKFVLGVLNSAVGRYLCSQYVSILDDGGYLMQKIYLEKIPMPPYSAKLEKIIENNWLRIDENEINNFVYDLFNLTKEEINFIESLQNQPLQRSVDTI